MDNKWITFGTFSSKKKGVFFVKPVYIMTKNDKLSVYEHKSRWITNG
jgi:hypothetical protein